MLTCSEVEIRAAREETMHSFVVFNFCKDKKIPGSLEQDIQCNTYHFHHTHVHEKYKVHVYVYARRLLNKWGSVFSEK
jgi:hypothetical protein